MTVNPVHGTQKKDIWNELKMRGKERKIIEG
jgi:hypothetical protein